MTSQKRIKEKNGWNTILSILLFILLILVLIYIIMAIIFSVKYNKTRKQLESFTSSHLSNLLDELKLKTPYDFSKDPLNFKTTVKEISTDLVDSLLNYYDGNLNTVAITINNLTAVMPANLGDTGGVPENFNDAVIQFSALVVKHVPLQALYRSAYMTRFFEMIFLASDTETQKALIADIYNAIQKLFSKMKPKPTPN
jgi:hypothetical protein